MPEAGVVYESFQHPSHGFLDFDPHTGAIRQPIGKSITWPIGVPDRFFGKDQPHVPTCSRPSATNKGCAKWHGCPLKDYVHVGPGIAIIRKKDAISMVNCYDHFSARDEAGKLIFQTNWSEQGFKMDTSRTTIPVLGAEPVTNPMGQTIGRKVAIWQKDVPDLLPFWWPLLKKQGKPLPPSAKHYPQLAEDDEEEISTTTSSAVSRPPASRGGRKKRTRKVAARSATGSRKPRSAPQSSVTPDPDV